MSERTNQDPLSLRIQIAAILGIAIIPATLHFGYLHNRSRTAPSIELKPRSDEITVEALDRSDSGALWVDARSLRDFESARVPGALHLNDSVWNENLPRLLDTWRPGQLVIVYCSMKECEVSRSIANRLREGGVSPVYVLHGGWAAWLAAHPG